MSPVLSSYIVTKEDLLLVLLPGDQGGDGNDCHVDPPPPPSPPHPATNTIFGGQGAEAGGDVCPLPLPSRKLSKVFSLVPVAVATAIITASSSPLLGEEEHKLEGESAREK